MMNHIRTALLVLVLAGPLATAAAGQDSASAIRLTVREDSKLWIEGRATLRDWSCTATSVDAAIEVDQSWAFAVATRGFDLPSLVRRVDIKVPVRSLKCGNAKMERVMYSALKADDVPDVAYIMGSFIAEPSGVSDGYLLQTNGTLRIAGRANTVRMAVRAERLADGSVRAVSEVPILMSEYGVKPPTALLGAIRANDRVVVKFELFVTAPRVIAATP